MKIRLKSIIQILKIVFFLSEFPEYELPAFYELINSNRELIGWNKVEEVEPTETTEKVQQNLLLPFQLQQHYQQQCQPKSRLLRLSRAKQQQQRQNRKKLTVETGNAVTVKVDSTDVVFPDTSRLLMKTDEHKCRFVRYLKCLTAKVDWDDTSKRGNHYKRKWRCCKSDTQVMF